MPGFTVDIKGLDRLRKDLAGSRVRRTLASQLGLSVIQLESKITEAVEDRYYTPHPVRTALAKRASASRVTTGKNLLTFGLVYKFIPVPLHQFPFIEEEVAAKSRFLIPRGNGKFRVVKKGTARAVAVKVRRDRGARIVIGKKGFGGFYQRGGVSKWAAIQGGVPASFRTGIYERQTSETWNTEPVERAPIAPLWGPTIADMVGVVFETSPIIEDFINNLENLILDNLEL